MSLTIICCKYSNKKVKTDKNFLRIKYVIRSVCKLTKVKYFLFVITLFTLKFDRLITNRGSTVKSVLYCRELNFLRSVVHLPFLLKISNKCNVDVSAKRSFARGRALVGWRGLSRSIVYPPYFTRMLVAEGRNFARNHGARVLLWLVDLLCVYTGNDYYWSLSAYVDHFRF